MNVCTIIAKNYLAHARVLGRSLAQHDPQARLWTLVIDDFEQYIDPSQEPFEVLTPAGVGCAPFTQMALRYSVLELSTAVKPWLLRHVMEQTGGPVTYLDPDIEVFGPLRRLDELASEHGLALTPHNNQPIPADGRKPSQVDIMIAGVYNLGYLSLAPRAEIESLLDWWADRLIRDCRVDPIWGYFVDQRWFDLAPGLVSDLAIVRDPEFNVAYWNLHSRRLERRGEDWLVDGRPLAFFHFSGFDPDHPLVLSRHQDRIDVVANPPLQQMLAQYAAKVLAEGHAVSRRWPYSYGALGDGTHLDEMLRGLYDAFTNELEQQGQEVPSPFELEGIRVFDGWLRSQAPGAGAGVNRALAHLYEGRSDLRAAYPDLAGPGAAGLLTWAEQYGRHEVPLLARVMSDGASTAAGDPNEAAESPAYDEPSQPLRDGPWGVNVVGPFGSELETGATARALLSALDSYGMPAAPVRSQGLPAGREERRFLAIPPAEAPFPVNVLCLSGEELLEFLRAAGRGAFAGLYSIGFWLWDGSAFPERWRPALALLSELWVPSAHARQTLTAGAGIPVTVAPIPVDGAGLQILSRASVGLPQDRFVFLSSFDYSEGMQRKNPGAVIDAFAAAMQPADGTELVLRCAGADRFPDAHAELRDAANRCGVTVIDREMSPAEERSLIALCDCFVSLHRAEAFGRRMAEAMWHGRPVIATGYSGNLDFMTASNSLLVDHRLVPIGLRAEPSPGDGEWAEPDGRHASARIRQVLDDRPGARRLGERAAADIRVTHSPAAAAEAMGRRLESIRATGRARIGSADGLELARAVAELPLRARQATNRGVAPGRTQRLRALARHGVLRLMRPVTVSQQTINEDFIAAMVELNRSLVELRREDAGKRAALLARLRRYERLAADGGRPEDALDPPLGPAGDEPPG